MNDIRLAPGPALNPAHTSRTYTNFPTLHLGSHVLLLRQAWPEDLVSPSVAQGVGPLHDFGTQGEVLTVSDHQGHTVAAMRVNIRFGEALPDPQSSPWPGAMASLRTALRYSRLGWLETGSARLQTGSKAMTSLRAALLWHGLVRLLERNGLGFALGVSFAPPSDADAPVTDMLPLLLERHGLPPEFSSRPSKYAWRPPQGLVAEGEPEDRLPADLREALRRGAKLCGDPLTEANGDLRFFWVAHRTLLQHGMPLI